MEIDWRNMRILFQDCLNKHKDLLKLERPFTTNVKV